MLVWISIIFLMFASLLPFSTSLLAESIGRPLPTLIYLGNFFVLQLGGYVTFSYATGKYRLADADISSHEIRARRRSWITGIVLVAIAIGISYVNTIVSIGLFVVFLFTDIAWMIVRFRIRTTEQAARQR